MEKRQIHAEIILNMLPANNTSICLNKDNDWNELLSIFLVNVFWKIFSKPLIFTYPPRGINDIFHLVSFLSVKENNDFPKPIEKSVTFVPKNRATE